jgi:hypothetical protein
MLEKHQSELIEHAMSAGALKFGTFTLKSGRYESLWDPKLHPHRTVFFFCKDLPVLFQCGSDKFGLDACNAIGWICVAHPIRPRVVRLR